MLSADWVRASKLRNGPGPRSTSTDRNMDFRLNQTCPPVRARTIRPTASTPPAISTKPTNPTTEESPKNAETAAMSLASPAPTTRSAYKTRKTARHTAAPEADLQRPSPPGKSGSKMPSPRGANECQNRAKPKADTDSQFGMRRSRRSLTQANKRTIKKTERASQCQAASTNSGSTCGTDAPSHHGFPENRQESISACRSTGTSSRLVPEAPGIRTAQDPHTTGRD